MYFFKRSVESITSVEKNVDLHLRQEYVGTRTWDLYQCIALKRTLDNIKYILYIAWEEVHILVTLGKHLMELCFKSQ